MIMSSLQASSLPAVVILAAGQGKRMRSSLPKVLHELGGKPLLYHVLSQVHSALPGAAVAIVVGHGHNAIENYVRSEPKFQEIPVTFVFQEQQKGTGHAARCAVD